MTLHYIGNLKFIPGLEGLSISASGTTLYALLQSAVMQDGGGDKDTNRYTRLLSYNISGLPTLVGEFIVPLPQSKKGKTFPASEVRTVLMQSLPEADRSVAPFREGKYISSPF